jgi:hypothetical protein
LIYTRLGEPARLGIAARVMAVLTCVACLTVLGVAARLPPNHQGIGTHTELGFAGCSFLNRTGLPCPSCGMTTSFSWFVRGNLLASLYVQPMGTALALLTMACAWTAGYVALTGRPAHRLMRLIEWRYYLIPLMTIGVLAWGWKMFIHLKGIDGW